jgi:hypothetical protein
MARRRRDRKWSMRRFNHLLFLAPLSFIVSLSYVMRANHFRKAARNTFSFASFLNSIYPCLTHSCIMAKPSPLQSSPLCSLSASIYRCSSHTLISLTVHAFSSFKSKKGCFDLMFICRLNTHGSCRCEAFYYPVTTVHVL